MSDPLVQAGVREPGPQVFPNEFLDQSEDEDTEDGQSDD